MKAVTRKAMFLMFALTLTVSGLATASKISAQNNSNQGASGQGSLPAITESGDTRKRQFSLSAQRRQDGTVNGRANLHNPAFTVGNGQKYQLQIDISCMKIIGNVAFFGGLTRRTNDESLVDAVYFSVEDNGNPGGGRDKISRVFFFDDDPNTTGDPQLCQNNVIGDFPLEVIESGNINLRNGM